MYGRQDQPYPQWKPQLGGEAVVQGTPEHQSVVGNKQGVDKHHNPGPGDRPQLPKGEEKQVKLQDQPVIWEKNDNGEIEEINDVNNI